MGTATRDSGIMAEPLLTKLPFDILVAIYSLLHPQDLISLSRTSHDIYEMLISDAVGYGWKASRDAHDIPQSPSGSSEWRWAELLFGSDKCQICCVEGMQLENVDFHLSRRVCATCKRLHTIPSKAFSVVFPAYDIRVLNLIAYTRLVNEGSSWQETDKYYWKDDIKRMASIWNQYLSDINDPEVSGAIIRFEELREQRKCFVAAVVQNSKSCYEWAHKASESRRFESNKQKQACREEMLRRFSEMPCWRRFFSTFCGVEVFIREIVQSMDTECFDEDGGHFQLHKKFDILMHRTGWPRLRDIISKRAIRRAKMLCPTIMSRMKILEGLYFKYIRSTYPETWRHIYKIRPSHYDIAQIGVFAKIINSSEEDITEQNFTGAMEMLPELIPRWNKKWKEILCSMVVNGLPDLFGFTFIPTDVVSLALSIFVCDNKECRKSRGPGKQPFFAWEEVSRHKCGFERQVTYTDSLTHFYDKTEIVFSIPAAHCAQQLVALTGRNAITTSATEMDDCQTHFLCGNCPPRFGRDTVYGREVFAWRAAIRHELIENHQTPRWATLNSELGQELNRIESMG
ncbi:hypothetical protein BDQ12DRAFT_739133 [Crucibulum laeve]|uniref:F-box domain-containing protein n=1 Tax=Crucibulum laeve TaxID=68775 RepID=A0A5C3LJT4_9AGAR|nr:hypothetical protein BDQ12DRAFT_739133 [Crucibulum laeve]